ncbi:MAG: acetyl-CoA acetyltransferase [Actinomycetota bacterium]|nr:acetyl-CoA acetyltransferase [Actinomycetota bacterium]
MTASKDSDAVIIGVGHTTRHPGEPAETTEPARLIAAAIDAATEDARLGASGRGEVDSLDVINFLSWQYLEPAQAVAHHAGLAPRRVAYSPVGGDQPTLLLDAAARRIASGQSRLAIVAGGEAMASRRIWQRAGQKPPWPRIDSPPRFALGAGLNHGAFGHGLTMPTNVYPLVESAHRAAAGVGFDDAQRRSGALWAGLSAVAARTPGAWLPEVHSLDQIITPGPDNRPIAHPYLKLMCAQPMVDQSAAVVVASVAEARRLGVPPDDWVYLLAGAGAMDTEEVMERPSFACSDPMSRVLHDALRQSGMAEEVPDLLELYSCFPIVVKLALETLGLPDDAAVSVAGGLTFYGGPFNTYMLCAAVNMVRLLRAGAGTAGLLYGNGEFVTKHHALVVGRVGRSDGSYPTDHRVDRQQDLDRRMRPNLTEAPHGRGTIEATTVLFDRDGLAERGIVVGRLDDDSRFVANTPPDAGSLSALLDPTVEPIGRSGEVRAGESGNLFELS